MKYSVELNNEEVMFLQNYSQENNISIQEFILQSISEKIEDEIDRKAYNKAWKEYLESGKQSRPIEELWDEVDI